MLTGQISSHALHDVHAQISSAVMRSNSESALIVISGTVPIGGDDRPGVPVAAMTSPVLSTISRGSSGLPVACAGQTRRAAAAHGAGVGVEQLLPGEVLDRRRRRSVSSSVSIRLGIGFIAPLGRSRSRRYMFSGRREHVPQHRDGQDHEEARRTRAT